MASRVRILPEILSNKIAAGEVVERPASVVKELVENALDAGADRIRIDIEKGGRARIQVVDNGIGMGRDDALLALERYATSKIYRDEDLFNIRTLGFRGEALPSIASVAKLVLETREADADIGTRIEVSGGRIGNVMDAGIPPGTLVEVKSLFFNTPARRKFLKTIPTEMGHISDTVSAVALGWPRVAFRLIHNGKTVKDWPASDFSADRAADVLGGDVRDRLREIDQARESISLKGWIADPSVFRNTFRGIYVFVNGRHVRDRVIQHALMEGYLGRLMKGRFPVGVLFLTLPPDRVDVNVHPTKNEVRFTDSRMIHQLVSQAVFDTLDAAEKADRPRNLSTEPTPTPQTRFPKEMPSPSKQLGLSEPAAAFPLGPSPSLPDLPPHPQPPPTEPAPEWESGSPVGEDADVRFKALNPIGQLHGMYVLCESSDGLIIIDQHAAHERILYEKLKRQMAENRLAVQQLLIPETVELNHGECAVLEEMLPQFAKAGIILEPFGGTTFVVKAVPAPLSDAAIAPLVLKIVETVSDVGAGEGPEGVMDEILKRTACHGAIRAHQTLAPAQIRRLLADMDAFPGTGYCPHGRPTWIRWDSRFLKKAFGRIV